jgi:hypothetical protein
MRRWAVDWVEREFATPNLIHARDQERAGYSITVGTSEGQLLMVNQLLVTLLDDFLSDHTPSEGALLLDVWQVANTMRWAGAVPACRCNYTGRERGTPVIEAGGNCAPSHLHADCLMLWNPERGPL